MNFRHIMIVFKKEMKDAFRDKKSVLTNIFLPLILIPLIYFFMNMAFQGVNKDVEENMKIAVITSEDKEQIDNFTKENIIDKDNIQIVQMGKEEAKQALIDGDIHCILVYPENFLKNLEDKIASNIKVEYNALKSSSELGMQKLRTKIMMLNQNLAHNTLSQMNISPEILNLLNQEMVDISFEINDGKDANSMMTMIIPMYLVIVIITAGIPIAIDVVAGERERNTFEPLLSTKANRLSILIGKYLSVLVFSVIAIIMSFIGLIIGIVLNPEMFSTSSEVMNLSTVLESMNMPISVLVLILLNTITLAVVFAGIQIGISTWSKTVKEAQTYLSYMTFPAMIIGFGTMFMGAADIKAYMAYIPVFNTVAAIKTTLSGVISYNFLIISILVNIVCIIIVTWYIIRMFKKEKVIIK